VAVAFDEQPNPLADKCQRAALEFNTAWYGLKLTVKGHGAHVYGLVDHLLCHRSYSIFLGLKKTDVMV
jgi:hypothetical protein